MATTEHPHRATADEISAVVAALEQAQRSESVEDFVALFGPDAVWTTGHGRVLLGRTAIAAFTAQVLPGSMEGGLTPCYDVEHIGMIRPDVAVAKVRQHYEDGDGNPVNGVGSPTYVMTRDGDGWRIVVGQNTEVINPHA
jgi:uncharacterized protein (TIGR02246 family)